MEGNDAADLIELAMRGVRVVECPMCEGIGKLTKALDLTCPRCEGSGKTTTSGVPLSKWDQPLGLPGDPSTGYEPDPTTTRGDED